MKIQAAGHPPFHYHWATAEAPGAIAVFELYGPAVAEVAARFFRARSLPAKGRAALGTFAAPEGDPLDEVLLAHVPAEASWSGLEHWTLSIHGGLRMAEDIRAALERYGGSPLARDEILGMAVKRGRLDAIQAAAFSLLPSAPTGRAAVFLAHQHRGALSGCIKSLLERLEGPSRDTPEALAAELDTLLERYRLARKLLEPLRILISGRPNAGKSTLFNRMLGLDRVLTTSVPGTTRDLVVERAELEGFPLEIADAAGLRPDPRDPVEAEGIRKVLSLRPGAVIHLVAPPWRLRAFEQRFLERVPQGRRIIAANFCDLLPPPAPPEGWDCAISARTGWGLAELLRRVQAAWLGPPEPAEGDPPAPFTEAQRAYLEEARSALREGRLDAAKEALIMTLARSWSAVPADPQAAGPPRRAEGGDAPGRLE